MVSVGHRRRSMPPKAPVEGIVSGGATHLDGDAGHDLQRERHLERLVVVALVDEAQMRLRVRQAETADTPRAQRRRPVLHICRLLPSPSSSSSSSPPPSSLPPIRSSRPNGALVPRALGRARQSRAINYSAGLTLPPIRPIRPPRSYRNLRTTRAAATWTHCCSLVSCSLARSLGSLARSARSLDDAERR